MRENPWPIGNTVTFRRFPSIIRRGIIEKKGKTMCFEDDEMMKEDNAEMRGELKKLYKEKLDAATERKSHLEYSLANYMKGWIEAYESKNEFESKLSNVEIE